MKPSKVPVNSILPILPILLTPPEVYGSLRCLGLFWRTRRDVGLQHAVQEGVHVTANLGVGQQHIAVIEADDRAQVGVDALAQ